MRIVNTLLATVVIAFAASGNALALEFTFDWSSLKLCTSGQPNIVKNPIFTLTDVPAGTKFIRFRLKDKNAPSYNHGGGLVVYTGQDTIAPGAFTYKSPCPPSGKHTYEWKATAQSKKSGGRLGTAKSAQKYP